MRKKVESVLFPCAFRVNRWLRRYREKIWLIGDGRSGTTWVADLLNSRKRYREMFEPFHPGRVESMEFLTPHQYLRADEWHSELERAAAAVFSGRFTDPRVDATNRSLLYDGLLIKDIFANLFAHWASRRFPDVKVVLLLRNPFAVALSKSKKQHWYWATDPLALLDQTALREDWLVPFVDLIERTGREEDFILHQVLIWAVIHHVPLCQFEPERLHVVFYEDVFVRPAETVREIVRFLRPEGDRSPPGLDAAIIDRPSRTSGAESTLVAGTSPVTAWKDELSAPQIDAGLQILEAFGFDGLYDERSMPNQDVIDRVRAPAGAT